MAKPDLAQPLATAKHAHTQTYFVWGRKGGRDIFQSLYIALFQPGNHGMSCPTLTDSLQGD